MRPDVWILMGGAAIATLAGDHVDEAGVDRRMAGDGRDVGGRDGVDPAAGVRLYSAPHRPGVAGGVPARDVLVGHVCRGRRNRLAMADCRVAGVLVDRVRGMAAHRRSSRSSNFGDHALRILRQVQPREAQHLPAEQRELVLPFAVDLKVFRAAVKGPAVDFDCDLLLRESDVDLVSAHRIVRLPSGNAVVPQQLDEQTFGLRPRAVGGGPQQSSCRGGAVTALVAQMCPPQLRQLDVALQCRVH